MIAIETTIATVSENNFQASCRRVAEFKLKRTRMDLQLTSAEASAEAEENASMCERILADLEAIFRKEEANILDFDIIGLSDSTFNKSPVVYVDRHLALERWAVPHLYQFACRKVLQARTSFTSANGGGSACDLHSVHQCTRILLLINPDLTTAWNLRREMIKQHQHFQSPADELRFTALVLARKPKCASAFSYREWLLNGLINSAQMAENLEAMVDELVTTELTVTLDAASRYSRNYYAWSHRTWLLTAFLHQQQQRQQKLTARLSEQFIVPKVHHDLEVTAQWLEGHISDYSCLQHRQSLLLYLFEVEEMNQQRNQHQPNNNTTSTSSSSSPPLLSSHPQPQPSAFFELLQREFTFLESLFPLYPEQESLLLHRRVLLKVAVQRWCRGDPEKINHLRHREKVFYQDHVAVILKEKLSSSSSSTINSLWQIELFRRYLAYLRRNLNWSFTTADAS